MLLFPLVPGGQFVVKKLCANPQRHASGKSFCAGEMQKYTEKVFLAFCGEFFILHRKSCVKNFCCKMKRENVVLKMTEICQAKN